MAARGCALVPTLAIYRRLAEHARVGSLTGTKASRAHAVGQRLGGAVAIAKAAGVTIALGSDFGHRDDHGSNLEEISLLHQAGLTVEEALLAATWAGAELCGVEHRLGRLAPGFEFDAVLLDADPFDMQTYTRRTSVTGVFKKGVAVVRHPRLDSPRRPVM
jgi:imidazolonepropionase-like amidohydrolase